MPVTPLICSIDSLTFSCDMLGEARTAKVQQRQQDIKILSQGCNALDSATIAEVLNIPEQELEDVL